MKKVFIFLTAALVLAACNSKSSSNNNVESASIDCSVFEFDNAQQRADTLLKYYDKEGLAADESFFCAFPETFSEMQKVFGFDAIEGAAPLYDYPIGKHIIEHFANLNSIDKEIYYNKYINICIDGVWEADNIRVTFGFADRLMNDTDAACLALSKRTDKEVISVFHFIFDGPIPKNEFNEEVYNKLLPLLTEQDERLAALLEDTYNRMISEYVPG